MSNESSNSPVNAGQRSRGFIGPYHKNDHHNSHFLVCVCVCVCIAV